MIGFLYRMLIGRFTECRHEWETIKIVGVYGGRVGGTIGDLYTLKCKKCGDIQSREVTV